MVDSKTHGDVLGQAGARDEALANVRAVAAEVAQAATERLIGAEVPESEAAGAVDAAVKERG